MTGEGAAQSAEKHGVTYPDDPPGIDPTTHDMPPVDEAAERVLASRCCDCGEEGV